MKKKKQWGIGIGIVLVLLVVILIAVATRSHHNDSASTVQESTTQGSTETVTIDPSEVEEITAAAETMEGYVAPGKNTLELDKIAGYTQKKNNKKGNSNAPKKSEKKIKKQDEDGTSAPKDTQNTNISVQKPKKITIELSDPNLTIESVGSYTGNFLEDGSDEPVVDVTAIVITNHSKQMLQVGDITFQVNDTDTAKFRVTNLLPGASAMVLESNKRTYRAKDKYTYGKVVNAYLDAPDLLEKQFAIKKKNGELVLKNLTKKSYQKVYVYYKYTQSGGAYMGGITYRVPFENVEPKGTVTSVANHFSPYTSVIVDVQIAKE